MNKFQTLFDVGYRNEKKKKEGKKNNFPTCRDFLENNVASKKKKRKKFRFVILYDSMVQKKKAY